MFRILHKLYFKKWIFINNHLLSFPSYWQQQSHEEPGLCILLACMKQKKKWTWLYSKFFVSTWVPECAGNDIIILYTCIFSQLLKFCLWSPKIIAGKHKLHWGIWICLEGFVWKVLSIGSTSLFEKLQLFCRVKIYLIIDAISNPHTLPAAISCQGAGGGCSLSCTWDISLSRKDIFLHSFLPALEVPFLQANAYKPVSYSSPLC